MAIAFGASIGTAVGASPDTTWDITTTGAVPAGGHVIVGVAWFHASATETVSGGGLSWTRDVVFTVGSDHVALWSAPAPAGLASSSTITATVSANSFSVGSAAMYATGLATSSWEDDDGTNNAATAAWSASLTTLTANTLLVSFGYFVFGAHTSSSGTDTEWSDFQNAPDDVTFSGVYRIVSSTGTYTPGGTWSASNNWIACAVAYKADTGGAAAAPSLIVNRSAVRLA